MLVSRDTEDVIEWLKGYQNIKVVVGYGSIGYKAVITKALQRTINGRIEINLT